LRRYLGGERYAVETLGMADDARAVADGLAVLSYEDAREKALAALSSGAEGAPVARLTVRRAIENYIDFLKSQGKATNDTERRCCPHRPKLGDTEVWIDERATAEVARQLRKARLARSKKDAKKPNTKQGCR
jgi:hypothetical protein